MSTGSPAPAGLAADWWASVQEDIRQAEYQITWQMVGTDGRSPLLEDIPQAYHAPNRAHNLRTYFTPRGIQVIPRTEQTPSWQVALSLAGYAAAEDPKVSANRIEYRYKSGNQRVRGWYVNDEKGLEQGFALQGPAAGVILRLAFWSNLSPTLTDRSRAIEFRGASGDTILRYGDLQVLDTSGREIPARFSIAPSYISILLDSPAGQGLTIHARLTFPSATAEATLALSPTPAWIVEGEQDHAHLGWAAATAGDINGDGYSDVVVGAPHYDNGQTDEGRIYVYHGSAGGLSTSPNWTAEGEQTGAEFGDWVAPAGDVNGDGFDDIVVGAWFYDGGQSNEGAAFVYYGSPAGLSASPDWMAESDQAGAYFGCAVDTAGDVNGDGYDDVLVGSFRYDNGQSDEGRAFVYHGSAAGLNTSPDWIAEGNQSGGLFGRWVSTAGDVNGDGFGDVIVGAYLYDNGQVDEGAAFVYHGSAAGLSLTPSWTSESNQTDARIALVNTAGDVNGDGYSDVVVGATGYDNGQVDEGLVRVYHGSAAGLGTTPAWTAESDQAGARMGAADWAGDVNGDGYDDVIVGAYLYDNGETDEGISRAYLGSAAGLDSMPAWTTEGDQDNAWFGNPVVTAGDVNGDGYDDVLVGARYYNNGQVGEGRVYVYHGSASGLGPTPPPDWEDEGDQAGAYFGCSVGTAGDVNGDGYDDIVVGAYGYDNGQVDEGAVFVYHGSSSGPSLAPDWISEGEQTGAWFGRRAGTAGDINGDGFADLVVGAQLYDNGQTNEGAAFVYHGSAHGLSTTPDWMAESNQSGAYMGRSVGTAGDVNGDGYADVIVGARLYDNGQVDEGAAFVYHGSAAGLGNMPDWIAEGDQANAHFSESLGTAGDVNGDGYDDVIIGARYYDNGQTDEGLAFAYYGSPAGLSPSANWTAEIDQAYASFGIEAGTAGDVNGDGYDDVVVGAPLFDNDQQDEGGAFVYHGSSSGLSLSPDWMAEGNQVVSAFGTTAGAAGDFDSDGFSDVIIGAYLCDNNEADEGAAYVYFGSATGLGEMPGWNAESNQSGAEFGSEVGHAGDVNGDGYDDVIVGARRYDNGQADEGAAFVYYGWGSPPPCDPVHDVDFSWTPSMPQVGEEVTFSGSASGSPPLSYSWDLGDGYTAYGPTIIHIYTEAGAYQVILTVSNDCGQSSATHTIIVAAPQPDIVVSPPTLTVTLWEGQTTTRTLTIGNRGEAELTWSLAEDPEVDWLQESPTNGAVLPGESTSAEVLFDADDLETGLYLTRLQIHSNDPDEPLVEVAVTLEVTDEALPVHVDIKPGSCPNPVNPRRQGVLPVAILGTSDFDVTMIDPATIRLEGLAPIRFGFEDVATPVWDRQHVCDCTTAGADGFVDLTLKFRFRDPPGDTVECPPPREVVLTLTARLWDGTPIRGQDCIVLLGEDDVSIVGRPPRAKAAFHALYR